MSCGGGNLLGWKRRHIGRNPRHLFAMDLPRSFPEFYAPPFAFRHDFRRSFASVGVTISSKAYEGGNRAVRVEAVGMVGMVGMVGFHPAPAVLGLLKYRKTIASGIGRSYSDMTAC
jgi:hypothetical protein